jgi:phosphoglucosamine mutase
VKRKYFGTDGVRGLYGGPVVNIGCARQLGAAAGRWLKESGKRKPASAAAPGGGPEAGKQIVLIGRDTRWSGSARQAAVAGDDAAQVQGCFDRLKAAVRVDLPGG